MKFALQNLRNALQIVKCEVLIRTLAEYWSVCVHGVALLNHAI